MPLCSAFYTFFGHNFQMCHFLKINHKKTIENLSD